MIDFHRVWIAIVLRSLKATTVKEKIGIVTDYLNRIGVAIVRLTDGDLHVGDHVQIAGRASELTQTVESLEVEHHTLEQALREQRGA